jgi:acyl carrier protein
VTAVHDALRNNLLRILDEVSSQDVTSRAAQEGEGFAHLNLRQIGLDSLGLLEFAIELEQTLSISLNLGTLSVTPESTVGELMQLAQDELSGK